MSLVPVLELPDLDDRHVLAAAIQASADAIVTNNAKHFPAHVLEKFGLETQTADEFARNIIERHPSDAARAIERMRSRYRRPPFTPQEFNTRLLGAGLIMTAAALELHLKRRTERDG